MNAPRVGDAVLSMNYPTRAERLASLEVVLRDIKDHPQRYEEAELADILSRLTCRIAELKREVREFGTTNPPKVQLDHSLGAD